jgi:nitrate/TMAO reductase-like tetraheme cytochrome c subunit
MKAFLQSRTKLVLTVGALALACFALTATYAGVTKITTSQNFCAHACHEMERTVAAEHAKSKHAGNTTCAGCHLPQNAPLALMGHQITALSRVWGHFVDREYLPGRFEARRPELAKMVLQGFADTNARECKACHLYPAMIRTGVSQIGRRDHTSAMKTDGNCLSCHQGVTHQRQDKPDTYELE